MNTPAQYFEQMYRDADDPWSLGSRWYEERKYALTLASLQRRTYASAFEAGCSVGVLSGLLAGRCSRLLSCDRSSRAVEVARTRLAGQAHVRVEKLVLPEEWPRGPFDLVVFSEVLYYFDPGDAHVLAHRAIESLEPGGELVAVHWRHPVAEHAQSADAVHEALRTTPELARTVSHEEPDFVLDVFLNSPRHHGRGGVRSTSSLSVAAAENLT